jgi:hypothetical protein
MKIMEIMWIKSSGLIGMPNEFLSMDSLAHLATLTEYLLYGIGLRKAELIETHDDIYDDFIQGNEFLG